METLGMSEKIDQWVKVWKVWKRKTERGVKSDFKSEKYRDEKENKNDIKKGQ